MSGIARLIVFEPNSQFTRLRVLLLHRSVRMMDCGKCSSQNSNLLLVSDDDKASEFRAVVETSTPVDKILLTTYLGKKEDMLSTSEMDIEEDLETQSEQDLEVDLQDIIRERKAERKLKAEEKRQLDLQRIRDMTSKTGIEPLERFPKEIWAEIFKWVEPEDRWSTWFVHPTFSQLMETSAIDQVLLPKVFKVDAFQHCFVNRADRESPVEFNKGLRYISRLSRDLFDCWMDANFEKEMKLDWYERPRNNNNIVTFEFFKSSHHFLLHRLLNAFGEGSNPAKRFFSRGFGVDYTEWDDERDIFVDNMDELRRNFHSSIEASLNIIGDQIWHFQFKTAYEHQDALSFTSFTSIYWQLLGLISKLGNLKFFQFSVSGREVPSENLCFLKAHPFPHIATLERITLEDDDFLNSNSCQSEILRAVLVANPQIKILDLIGRENLMGFLPVDEIKGLAHLSSFTVGVDGDEGFVQLRTIRSIVNFHWPLKTINLIIDMKATEMSSLFRFLEQFTSLENVKLDMYVSSIRKPDTWGYLELPNLKNLHLQVGVEDPEVIDYDSNIHFFFSLQFLIRCGNLETLFWMLYGHSETKLRQNLKAHEVPGKIIDFRAGLRILYNSNIWQVFPSLQSCKVKLWKNNHETEKVHLSCSKACFHEYQRPAPGQKMSITQFLGSHKCCQVEHDDDDDLQHCCPAGRE